MTVSPMTIVTVVFICAGMVAAVGPHARSVLRTPGTLGMGTIMLGVLLVPRFSHFAATASAAILLLLVLAGGVVLRARHQGPLELGQKSAAAITVLDTAFMWLALLLMPAQATAQAQASTAVTGVARFDAVHAGTHLGMAGGLMLWLVLFVWAACAAVLIVPSLRRPPPDGLVHLVCSGSMIAAMVVMAV